jgi:hypothetical protein
MRQDPAFKDIFAYGFMVEELMRWFVGDLHGGRELVDALDFSLLLRVQEQSTTGRAGDKRSYANDIVWRVPFRGRPADGGDRAWLHLVLMIEVQGEVDHLMALRVRNYVDNHHLELWRGRRFGAVDRLAPVLPIVIYTGPSRWTAALWVIDLVTPGASDGVAADVSSRASRLFSGDGYLTVDTMRLPADDLRRDNAAALLAGLCNPTLEHVPAQAAALRARLNAPELRPLLETVLAWVQHVAERDLGFDLGIDDMAEVDRLHESGELEEFFATRRRAYQDRYRAEGVARGIEQGIEQGLAAERELLRRQAARKFGAGTAGRLAGLLAGVGDADQLAQAGDWIIDCATGEELIARFGNGSPRGS